MKLKDAIAMARARFTRNGLVLYVCLSDRCPWRTAPTTARSGPCAVLLESAHGVDCPVCQQPMAHDWQRVRFVSENEPE